jgi:hypothetical protein
MSSFGIFGVSGDKNNGPSSSSINGVPVSASETVGQNGTKVLVWGATGATGTGQWSFKTDLTDLLGEEYGNATSIMGVPINPSQTVQNGQILKFGVENQVGYWGYTGITDMDTTEDVDASSLMGIPINASETVQLNQMLKFDGTNWSYFDQNLLSSHLYTDHSTNVKIINDTTEADFQLTTIPYVVVQSLVGDLILPSTSGNLGNKINVTNDTDVDIQVKTLSPPDIFYTGETSFTLPSKMSLKVIVLEEGVWFNLNG